MMMHGEAEDPIAVAKGFVAAIAMMGIEVHVQNAAIFRRGFIGRGPVITNDGVAAVLLFGSSSSWVLKQFLYGEDSVIDKAKP